MSSFLIRARLSREGDWLFTKKLNSPEEFKSVKAHCVNRGYINPFRSIFIVQRMNTCQDFLSDLFLPTTTMVLAHKIDSVALKIFFILATLIVDAMTLPIRILTLIPSYLSYSSPNQVRENHPLHKYLSQEKADKRLLNQDRIYVEFISTKLELRGKYSYTQYGESIRLVELPVDLEDYSERHSGDSFPNLDFLKLPAST